MTTWVENPQGGRARGLTGIARAWVEVLVRPRRFFENGVAPGDQAPGLTFAVAVTLVYVAERFLLRPTSRPTFFESETASVLVGLLVAGLILAPAALHLTAALETVLLAALVPTRRGVSETVQVIAYATAPMALAGVAVPPAVCSGLGPEACGALSTAVAGWRVVCAVWGAGLLGFGLVVVHGATPARAVLAGAIPAVFVFGYLFGGVFAFEVLTGVQIVTPSPPTASDMTRQISTHRVARP